MFRSVLRAPVLAACLAFVAGCAAVPARPPLPTVPHVDLERFMGDWYVIASIPTFIERDAWAAIESYALDPDGTIATTFTFSQGGFDGPRRRYTPRGFVRDAATNATWGMQFIWPVRAEYLILDLADDYSTVIIGRNRRDYVWIMAREPVLEEATYAALVARVAGFGYDVAKLRRVPQRPIVPGGAAAQAPEGQKAGGGASRHTSGFSRASQ